MKKIINVLLLILAFAVSCDKPLEQVEVTSITLDKTELLMIQDDIVTLVATVKPDDASDKTVTWASSKPSVATVEGGKVKAVYPGTALITAKAGNKSASCAVTVSKKVIEVTEVQLNPSSLELSEGESAQLGAVVLPEDADDKSLLWTSSDPAVASVQDGLVTALKEGSTAIVASSTNGKVATCTVKVGKKVIPVTSIRLNHNTWTMLEGEEVVLTVTVEPEDATDKSVRWSTSDASVASVSEGLVSALKEGSAVITARVGELWATCVVSVSKKDIVVSGISLSKTSLSLTKGQSETLTATVMPENATDKSVTWTSSNASVASVDQNGKVTAVKSGSATITATAGDKSATCSVKVTTPVESITLDRSSITLEEGKYTTLYATVEPDDADNKTVSWSSSNTAVATVSDGKVTAKKEGTATITATAGDKSATCAVTVSKNVIAVSSITLNKSSLSLIKGQRETITATVKPENATDKSVTWTSSNASVASVDQNGTVTAVKSGNATITAKAGEKSATCAVTVTTPVESITLDHTSITVEEGKTTTLVATVTPDDADNKTVSWSSSNTSVATVTSGKVTAKKEGTSTITAKAGNKSATCTVTVTKAPIPATSVSLNKNSLDLYIGDSDALTATVSPSNTTDQLVWSSSTPEVATVSTSGVVTAVAEGSAVITASAGDKSASCNVTVHKWVEVTSVSLSQSSLTLNKGQSETLTATVSPSNANDKSVTWSSSNTGVATVDQNGKVTAVGGGNATITVTASNGKTATCAVTVVIPVTGISLSKSSLSFFKGDSETLVATVSPSDATNKKVTWSSGNTAIATVDQNGKVTGIGKGNATITASIDGFQASCSVTVKIGATSITLDKTSLTMKKGGEETLIATVSPEDADDKSVSWSSSNTGVATVDQNGKVKGVGGGTSTITASTANGKTATCTVTVNVAVTGVSLNKSELTFYKGDSETLVATVSPSDATNKTVTWSSGSNAVATVDQSGKVTAVGKGNTTITASIDGFQATCSVTVMIAVTSVTLNKTSLTLEKGGEETLIATVNPNDADDKSVSWSSSNTGVATVDQNGKVSAKGGGAATITVKTANGKTATCTVTVNVKVTGVTLDQVTLSVEVGQSKKLTATITPSDATDKTLTWSSGSNSIATVDQNGNVSGVSQGTTTITVTTGNGLTATCTVTVTPSLGPENSEDYQGGDGQWDP